MVAKLFLDLRKLHFEIHKDIMKYQFLTNSTDQQLDLEYFQGTVVTRMQQNWIDYERLNWLTQLNFLSQCFPTLTLHRINRVSCCSKESDAVGQGWSLTSAFLTNAQGYWYYLCPVCCIVLSYSVVSDSL